MITESENQKALIELIKELDDSDLLQLLAFAKGFEACKENQTAETNTQGSQTNPVTSLHH